MSLEDITAAAQALWAAADAYNGNAAELQAMVTAKLDQLVTTVEQQMLWSATLDANAAEPENARGGTYTDLKQLIDDAPRGAIVRIYMAAGSSYTVTQDISAVHKRIEFLKVGVGANPVLNFTAGLQAGENIVFGIILNSTGGIDTSSIDIALPTAKIDDNLPWSSWQAVAFRSNGGTTVDARFYAGSVYGGHLNETGLLTAGSGGIGFVRARSMTFGGAFNIIQSADTGSYIISRHAITLQNGATLTDGGTGTNNILIH